MSKPAIDIGFNKSDRDAIAEGLKICLRRLPSHTSQLTRRQLA